MAAVFGVDRGAADGGMADRGSVDLVRPRPGRRGRAADTSRITCRAIFGKNSRDTLALRPRSHELETHFCAKRLGNAAGRDGRRAPLAPGAGTDFADGAGHRLHHRGGDLRAHRRRGGQLRRPFDHRLLRRGRRGVCLRRAVLCRIRRHGPRRGQRLHLCLHHARRNFRLDHRLGPDPRILDGLRHCGVGVGALPE